MKKPHFTWSLVVVLVAFLSVGCKTEKTASRDSSNSVPAESSNADNADNSNRAPQAEAGNTNAAAEQAGSATEKPADVSPELVGTYQAREIREKGIVTLVSKIKTSWWFGPDQSYSRVSQVGGETYHSDTGTFRIEKPNKLLLTIQFSREKSTPKIHRPPLQRTHIFSLSPDGEELQLSSEKGSVAVFKRIAKTKVRQATL